MFGDYRFFVIKIFRFRLGLSSSLKKLSSINVFLLPCLFGFSTMAEANYSFDLQAISSNPIEGHNPKVDRQLLPYILGFERYDGLSYSKITGETYPEMQEALFISGGQQFNNFVKSIGFFPSEYLDLITYFDQDEDKLDSFQFDSSSYQWFQGQGKIEDLKPLTITNDDSPCSLRLGTKFTLKITAKVTGKSKFGFPNEIIFTGEGDAETKALEISYYFPVNGQEICGLAPKSLRWWADNGAMMEGRGGQPKLVMPPSGGGYSYDFDPTYGFKAYTTLNNQKDVFPTTVFANASFKINMMDSATNYNYSVALADGSPAPGVEVTYDGVVTFNSKPLGQEHVITVKKRNSNIIVGTHRFIPKKWFESQSSINYWRVSYNYWLNGIINKNIQYQLGSISSKMTACPSGSHRMKYSELLASAKSLDQVVASGAITQTKSYQLREYRSAGGGVFDEWGNYMTAQSIKKPTSSDSEIDIYKLDDEYGAKTFTKTTFIIRGIVSQVALHFTYRERDSLKFPDWIGKDLNWIAIPDKYNNSAYHPIIRVGITNFLAGTSLLAASDPITGLYKGWHASMFQQVDREELKKTATFFGGEYINPGAILGYSPELYLDMYNQALGNRNDVVTFSSIKRDDKLTGWICVTDL